MDLLKFDARVMRVAFDVVLGSCVSVDHTPIHTYIHTYPSLVPGGSNFPNCHTMSSKCTGRHSQ